MNADIAIQIIEHELRLARSKGATYVFFDMTNETIRETILYYYEYPIRVDTKTFFLCLSSGHVSHYTSERDIETVLRGFCTYGDAHTRIHVACITPLKKPIKYIKRTNNENR